MRRFLMAAVLALLAAGRAEAALLLFDPGTGSTTTFTAIGSQGFGNPGPVVLDGFSVTGSPQATYGNASYFINQNGIWDQFSWIATNNNGGSVTFDLGGLYGLVGGFLNYGSPPTGFSPTISAIGEDGTTVLESYNLLTDGPISTPGQTNAGAFRGIERATADIRYFRIANDFILIHNLEVGRPAAVATPEPASLISTASGLLAIGFYGWRRSRRKAA